MKKEKKLTGVQTSAGKGARSRPLNLYSSTFMIPKGLMRLMGLPISEIQLEQFKLAGIKNVYVITQFLANRDLLSNRFSEGTHRFGLRIYYSDPALDDLNNGSGGAILTNILENSLSGDSICLANDNHYEYDAEKVIRVHRETGAAISILAVPMIPRATIRNYGLLEYDINHRVRKIIEKPESEGEIVSALRLSSPADLDNILAMVNTGGYVLNNEVLATLAHADWVVKRLQDKSTDSDIAGWLLKRMIEKDLPVYMITIDDWGDLGQTNFLMETVHRALGGSFPSIHRILSERGSYTHNPANTNNVWIHNETLSRKDRSGRTLEQRIASGDVKIGPNVFIGRNSVVEDGADISFSDLEKYTLLGENSVISHIYMEPYCIVGPYANITNSALGLQVRVNSTKKSPTRIGGNSVIGPDLNVPAGVRIENVVVGPGYRFQRGRKTYTNVVLQLSYNQAMKYFQEYKIPQ